MGTCLRVVSQRRDVRHSGGTAALGIVREDDDRGVDRGERERRLEPDPGVAAREHVRLWEGVQKACQGAVAVTHRCKLNSRVLLGRSGRLPTVPVGTTGMQSSVVGELSAQCAGQGGAHWTKETAGSGTQKLTAGEVLALDHAGTRRAGAANGPGGWRDRGRGEAQKGQQHLFAFWDPAWYSLNWGIFERMRFVNTELPPPMLPTQPCAPVLLPRGPLIGAVEPACSVNGGDGLG